MHPFDNSVPSECQFLPDEPTINYQDLIKDNEAGSNQDKYRKHSDYEKVVESHCYLLLGNANNRAVAFAAGLNVFSCIDITSCPPFPSASL